MSSDVQIPMADRVRSLERNEAQVLYGRCQGLAHGQIAAKYGKTSDTWSRNLMTRVFDKVGTEKTASRNTKSEFLKTRVCPVLEEILHGDEANLERWPLYGWVLVSREGDNATYREREERERPYPDVRDDAPEPDDIDLPLDNEEAELEQPGGNQTEDIEENQEELNEGVTPRSSPPITNATTTSPAPEQRRGFEWWLPTNQRINRFLPILVAIFCIGCVGLAIFARGALRPLFTTAPTFTPSLAPTNAPTSALTITPPTSLPTQTPPSSPTPAVTSMPATSATPEDSQTPEETATSENPPTAIPLPIKEDFSHQYSELWRVIGNPFITENVQFADSRFSGVLTTDMGDTATLWIGNTAWTDYLVSLRVSIPFRDCHLRIGLRVKDINNMVALDCGSRYSECSWIIIENGQEDRLPTETQLYKDPLTITVQGDTFTAVGNFPDYPSQTMSLILPPKYKGKFNGGGVLLQITSSLTIDFIQIDPFP
jgi:hypothetical protein